jgi:Cof subfamily protein (haloacid dehalogenase superfamily)
MSYRLLALDVDGTLLDSSGVVRPRVAAAVERAMSAGCRVVLATGRRLQSAIPIARRLGISTLILTDGTVVYDLNSARAIYERTIEPSSQRDAIQLVVDAGIQPVLLESPAAGGMILTGPALFDNPEVASYVGPKVEVRRLSMPDLSLAGRVVTLLALGDEVRIESLNRQASRLDCFSLTYWRPSTSGYHHFTLSFAPPRTSKGLALAWLAAEVDVPLAETMAVGDYENDVSLLEIAGWGVAMGNAVASVIAVASAVVADNDHDGVAEAIERWILNGD